MQSTCPPAINVHPMTDQQRLVRHKIRLVAQAFGVNPDWIDAICWVESRWTEGASNPTGSDGARGGAWGPLQLTMLTARNAGFTGTAQDLQDAELSALWFCKIQAARPGGLAETLEDTCAWWNAGKASIADAPLSTKNEYVPAAKFALTLVQSNPVE